MRHEKLWVFAVLPIAVINLGMMFSIGTYFALAATQPALVAGFGQGQLSFALSMFICIVEWSFAGALIRRIGWTGARNLVSPNSSLWKFRRLSALLVFIVLNGIFAAYIAFTIWTQGSWYRIDGLAGWQKIVMLTFLPFTAGFCEELIWRGYIFTQLETRSYGLVKAIVLSAISFALIHGITLPDKLLTTFSFGIVAGLYYAKERNLIPLMTTHIVMDVWSFGLSIFS